MSCGFAGPGWRERDILSVGTSLPGVHMSCASIYIGDDTVVVVSVGGKLAGSFSLHNRQKIADFLDEVLNSYFIESNGLAHTIALQFEEMAVVKERIPACQLEHLRQYRIEVKERRGEPGGVFQVFSGAAPEIRGARHNRNVHTIAPFDLETPGLVFQSPRQNGTFSLINELAELDCLLQKERSRLLPRLLSWLSRSFRLA